MISPQGYKLGEDPKSKNPFWGEGEDSDVNRIFATATVDEGTGVPSVTTSKTVSGSDITFGFDFHNLKGKDGVGKKGDPGFSPSARVEQIETGATITITDKSGTTTATIENGTPGKNGDNGFSPSARVEQIETGATITITDKSGTTTATVENGKPGKEGDPGPAGPGVPAGGTAGQVLTKVDGTDYNTEWKDITGGGGSAQIVKWVETDYGNAVDIYPRREYSGYNVTESNHTGSELESVQGEMDGVTYNISFSDNVTLDIPGFFEYLYEAIVFSLDMPFSKDHSSDKHYANFRIPNVETDIIISAEGHSPVKAKGGYHLSCTVEDGSTVYIEGTINTDAGSFITINKAPLLYFSSEYVDKYEVLKTQ